MACKRCGITVEASLEPAFCCTRRRCPWKGMLEAKAVAWEVANDGPEPLHAKREAYFFAMRTMIAARASGAKFEDWQSFMWDHTVGPPRGRA